MDGNGFNLADIRTVLDGNNSWGGGNIIWLFVIALLFGGNGFGWGNRGGANCATTEDLASGFNFSGLQNKTNEILAAVNTEGRTTDNAICQLGNGLMQQIFGVQQAQADCCCTTQRAIDSVKFDMANYASAINANTTAGIQKVLDKMCEQENAALQARVNQLETAKAINDATCNIPRINNDAWGVRMYPGCYQTCNPCCGTNVM